VHVSGRIAYVAQTAWIQTGTVRDNILFGMPYDEARYKSTIKACALEQDIKNFSHGELTEIGERGINMSGGQKQRIQLARAVYNDADVYLLDDPFSAVDAQTAAALFNVRHPVKVFPRAFLSLFLLCSFMVVCMKARRHPPDFSCFLLLLLETFNHPYLIP
jgi:ABC-type protease/lipase transport system fused ATPase/permease subunit